MTIPTTRDTFKTYCLRRLGDPVIQINVDPDQVDDRVDDALKMFWEYHFDGAEKSYYKYQVTPTDVTNRYITLPTNIIGAIRIFDIGYGSTSAGMFSLQYQIALNDLYTLTSQSMVPYYMTLYQLQFMEQLLVGLKAIRYNRHNNILYVDMDWSLFNPGDYIIVEAYQIIDPDVYVDAWNNRWLQAYATALIKKQWGLNLTKFVGMQLPGGVQFNGERILSDAQVECQQLENDIMNGNYSLPVDLMWG